MTPNFSVNNAAKDGDLIVAAAEAYGVRLDVAAAAAARNHRAAAAGHGEADMAATYLASFPESSTASGSWMPTGPGPGVRG